MTPWFRLALRIWARWWYLGLISVGLFGVSIVPVLGVEALFVLGSPIDRFRREWGWYFESTRAFGNDYAAQVVAMGLASGAPPLVFFTMQRLRRVAAQTCLGFSQYARTYVIFSAVASGFVGTTAMVLGWSNAPASALASQWLNLCLLPFCVSLGMHSLWPVAMRTWKTSVVAWVLVLMLQRLYFTACAIPALPWLTLVLVVLAVWLTRSWSRLERWVQTKDLAAAQPSVTLQEPSTPQRIPADPHPLGRHPMLTLLRSHTALLALIMVPLVAEGLMWWFPERIPLNGIVMAFGYVVPTMALVAWKPLLATPFSRGRAALLISSPMIAYVALFSFFHAQALHACIAPDAARGSGGFMSSVLAQSCAKLIEQGTPHLLGRTIVDPLLMVLSVGVAIFLNLPLQSRHRAVTWSSGLVAVIPPLAFTVLSFTPHAPVAAKAYATLISQPFAMACLAALCIALWVRHYRAFRTFTQDDWFTTGRRTPKAGMGAGGDLFRT